MKKLVLLTSLFAIFSCNSDDGNPLTECENKLWAMVENCPEGTGECSYIATYGATQATAGSIVTNESTYQYYTSRGNTNDGSQCWDGTK